MFHGFKFKLKLLSNSIKLSPPPLFNIYTMTSKKLVNSPILSAREACDGLLRLRPDLASVEGNPCVVVRRDVLAQRESMVGLISGGGSGHEPAHAGFVGSGLLSGAVCGNVFASPSVTEVFSAIRTCGSPKHGALLIVKNYTGDRINFGLAQEMAISEGIKTMMVVVDDDVALPEGKGITGGRGVAGTIFIHKIAGALANQGKSLEEIHGLLSLIVGRIGSLGIALTTCTVPGSAVSSRLSGESVIEVGMGIHGEPGKEQRQLVPGRAADEAAVLMVDAIVERKRLKEGDELVILLNNLGGLSVLELQVVCNSVLLLLKSRGFKVHRALWGHYMTSLEMSGVSLSILSMGELKEEILPLIDLPTTACGWNNNNVIQLSDDVEPVTIPYVSQKRKVLEGGPPSVEAISFVQAVCARLLELNKELNRLDSLSGDGDCGFTMHNLATAILAWLLKEKSGPEYHVLEQSSAQFLGELAAVVSASGGGTSGVLLELFLRAASNHFVNNSSSSSSADVRSGWIRALRKGCDAISLAGGAKEGMRTMLDALIPGLNALRSDTSHPSNLNSISEAAAAAERGMEATKSMDAKAGRANYVPKEQFQGHPDPGAFIVAEIFKIAVGFF